MEALEILRQSSEFGTKIVEASVDLDQFITIEFFQDVFREPEQTVQIVQIKAAQGRAEVELDDALKYAVILEYTDSSLGSQVATLSKHVQSPQGVHFYASSNSTEFKLTVVLFKSTASGLQLKIKYDRESGHSGSGDVVWKNYMSTCGGVCILMYVMIGLGCLVFLGGLAWLIYFCYNKKNGRREESEGQPGRQANPSQRTAVDNVDYYQQESTNNVVFDVNSMKWESRHLI